MQLLNPLNVEKMLLARQIGAFLTSPHSLEERGAVEDAARRLAADKNEQVRGVLASWLVRFEELPSDLFKSFVTDTAGVAVPFIEERPSMDDLAVAKLLPEMPDHSQEAVLQREDVGPETIEAVARLASQGVITLLIRNDKLEIRESSANLVIDRFDDEQPLMDQMSCRRDLSHLIENRLLPLVSGEFRTRLEARIEDKLTERQFDLGEELHPKLENEILAEIANISTGQMLAYVRDLHSRGRLTFPLILTMAEKGKLELMEAALAQLAHMTIGEVRGALTLRIQSDFVAMMKAADVPNTFSPHFLRLAREHYGPDRGASEAA